MPQFTLWHFYLVKHSICLYLRGWYSILKIIVYKTGTTINVSMVAKPKPNIIVTAID